MKITDLLRDGAFPDRDRHWLVPCLACAMGAGLIWFALDRILQFHRQGSLDAPWGWSARSLVLVLGVGLLLGLAGGRAERNWRRRHIESIRLMAAEMGLSHSENAEPLQFLTHSFRLLGGWQRSARLVSGVVDGATIDMFDLEHTGADGEGKVQTTILVLPGDGLPDMLIVPRCLLSRGKWAGLRFEATSCSSQDDVRAVADFTAQFVVHCGQCTGDDAPWHPPKGTAATEKKVRGLLTPPVMRKLSAYADWYLESHGNRLVLCRGRGYRPARERPEMIRDATAIRSILLQACSRSGDSLP